MNTFVVSHDFTALDTCHRGIQLHLAELQQVLDQLTGLRPQSDFSATVLAIEHFFSQEARQHHADEEEIMFPRLLRTASPERAGQIRSLIEDHFWIEKYWHDLSPQLIHLADSGTLEDPGAFKQCVSLFLDLCNRHIQFEESMIYPAAKSAPD